jgi:hypothetical protein
MNEASVTVAATIRLPTLLSEPEARRELGSISRMTLHRLRTAGEVQTVKIGRRRLYVSSSVLSLAKKGAAVMSEPPPTGPVRALAKSKFLRGTRKINKRSVVSNRSANEANANICLDTEKRI